MFSFIDFACFFLFSFSLVFFGFLYGEFCFVVEGNLVWKISGENYFDIVGKG